MASATRFFTAPDIHQADVLKTCASSFIDQSLESVDLQRNVITKVGMVIRNEPYLDVPGEERYVCPHALTSTSESEWNLQKLPDQLHLVADGHIRGAPALDAVLVRDLPAEYVALFQDLLQQPNGQMVYAQFKAEHERNCAEFLLAQKQTVTATVNDTLVETWKKTAAKTQEFLNRGPIAYVMASLQLNIDSVNKESGVRNQTRTFTAMYKISATPHSSAHTHAACSSKSEG